MQPSRRALQSPWMRLHWWLWFAILGGNALHGGAIRDLDVSTETTTTVRSGDTLVYHLFTWNFATECGAFKPARLSGRSQFRAGHRPRSGRPASSPPRWNRRTARSRRRSGISTFSPGFFTSSGYSGEVSTLARLSASFATALAIALRIGLDRDRAAKSWPRYGTWSFPVRFAPEHVRQPLCGAPFGGRAAGVG